MSFPVFYLFIYIYLYIIYNAYYYYYLVFRFRSRNALTPVEAIDLPAWVSMSLSYTTILSAKALKREV